MNQEFQNEITVTNEKTLAELEKTEEIAQLPEGNEPEAPKKKKSKAGKIVLGVVIGILALVLVAVIALGIVAFSLVNKAAAEVELPAKATASDMTEFGLEAAVGLLKEEKIVVDNADMQLFIEKVIPAVEEALVGTPVELKDLYCVFDDGKGTIYAQVYVSEVEVSGINLKIDKTLSLSADFEVNFVDNKIAAKIQKLTCGELNIPVSLVSGFVSDIQLPDGLTFEVDTIYYDVSGLDEMVDGILTDMLSETIGDGALASLVTDFLVKEVNAEINGAGIVGEELIINGKVL